MEAFVIDGPVQMQGEVEPQGAKNEALQILCATLLTPEEVIIRNVPDIRDVRKLLEIIRSLSVEVEQVAPNDWRFKAENVDLDYLFSEKFFNSVGGLRGSVMLMGPLLARYGRGIMARPGGDKIGRRRLDTHFLGLQKLGAHFEVDKENKYYRLSAEKLQGAYMLLDEASVTGTANIVMAATLAEGKTTIYNAACEPYLQQLCKMLNRMGARISGIGSNLLTIEGVDSLGGTEHSCLPDMIEVGSFISLAATTNSDITIKGAGVEHLGLIPTIFRRLGIQMEISGDNIRIPQQGVYEIETFIEGGIMTVADAPWPGFSPDLLSVLLVMATQAKGNVLIHQKMFESRLFFVDNLIDMGAQVILNDPHRATVMGLGRQMLLKGISMRSPDIRAGVALLIAALSAEGRSTIYNIEQIDRGYERFDERLNRLGANIQRVEAGS